MTTIESPSMKVDLLTDREQALERIYTKTYPMVRHYIRERGGAEEDAKDIFHEAIILFYEKTVGEQLTLTCSVSTYLMGICKNLWRQELEKRTRQLPLTQNQAETVWEQPTSEEETAPLKLITFVEQLGATCKSILVSFYYFGQRMEQIAAQHGYQNSRTATVQKFKCLERLRKAVGHLSFDHFKS